MPPILPSISVPKPILPAGEAGHILNTRAKLKGTSIIDELNWIRRKHNQWVKTQAAEAIGGKILDVVEFIKQTETPDEKTFRKTGILPAPKVITPLPRKGKEEGLLPGEKPLPPREQERLIPEQIKRDLPPFTLPGIRVRKPTVGEELLAGKRELERKGKKRGLLEGEPLVAPDKERGILRAEKKKPKKGNIERLTGKLEGVDPVVVEYNFDTGELLNKNKDIISKMTPEEYQVKRAQTIKVAKERGIKLKFETLEGKKVTTTKEILPKVKPTKPKTITPEAPSVEAPPVEVAPPKAGGIEVEVNDYIKFRTEGGREVFGDVGMVEKDLISVTPSGAKSTITIKPNQVITVDAPAKPRVFRGELVDAIVTRSAKEKGKFQTTILQKDGSPSGDSQFNTFEEAITEARRTTGVLTKEQIEAGRVFEAPPKAEIVPEVKGIESVLTRGKVKPTVRRVTGQTKVRDLVSLPEYTALKSQLRSESRVAKDAFGAGAVQTKEILKARVEQVAARRKMRSMINDIRSVDVKHMRPEFAQGVREVQEVLDFSVPTKKTISKLWSRKQYLEEFPDAKLPDYALEDIERLDKIRPDEITKEQLESLHTTVLHAAHLSRLKNQLIFKQQIRDANEVIVEAVGNIAKKQVSDEQEYDIDVTKVAPRNTALRNLFTIDSWNPELVTEIIDKDPDGVVKNTLFKNIDLGVTESLRYKQGIEQQWGEFLAESGIDINNWSEHFHKKQKLVDWQVITLPDGRTLKITPAIRVAFYMHSLNKKNKAHIVEGGVAFERNPTKIFQIGEDGLNAILATLTEEEKQVADALRTIVYDPQHEAINEQYLQLNGYPLPKEKNYLRIKVARISLPKEEKQLHRHVSQVALEEMGMLKERRNAKNPIIVEDIFKATSESVNNASTFIGLAIPMRDARLLLYSKRFESALAQTYGPAYHRYLTKYLEDVVGDISRLDNVEKLVASVRDRVTVALLGLNPFIWLYQPVSYLAASTEIDAKYLTAASKTIATPELIEKWTSRSPQVLERIRGGYSRDVAEVGRIGEVRKFWTGKRGLAGKLLGGIRNFDTKTVIRICEACEMEQRALGLTGDELARRSTERAEEVIRKTQPTYHTKDRSAVSRSRNPFVRLITMFTSQRNKNYIIQRRAIEKFGRSPKDPRDKAKLLWTLFLVSMGQFQLIRGLKKLRKRLFGLFKPKRKEERGITVFIRDWLGGVLSPFYLGSELATSLASKVERGTFAGYDYQNPLAQLVSTGVDAVAETVRGIEQIITGDEFRSGPKKGQPKWEASLGRALEKTSNVILTTRGIPFITIKEALDLGRRWYMDVNMERPKIKRTPTKKRKKRKRRKRRRR